MESYNWKIKQTNNELTLYTNQHQTNDVIELYYYNKMLARMDWDEQKQEYSIDLLALFQAHTSLFRMGDRLEFRLLSANNQAGDVICFNPKYDHAQGFSRVHVADGQYLIPYINRKGLLQLRFEHESTEINYLSYRNIKRLSLNNRGLRLIGDIHSSMFPLASLVLYLSTRSGLYKERMDIAFSKERYDSKKQCYRYHYELFVPTSMLASLKIITASMDFLDLFFASSTTACSSEESMTRVGNPKFIQKYTVSGRWVQDQPESSGKTILLPYLTLKGYNLSFYLYNLRQDAFEAYETLRKPRLLERIWQSKPKPSERIWLIGEREYKAQDNGYYFFRYLRTRHPELAVYYVIERDAPERKHVEPLGNVIYHKSKEHFELTQRASYICGTHHADWLYPIRDPKYMRHIHAVKVFLQHGVLGTKNIAVMYHKKISSFYTDLFIVSSEKEKNIVKYDMGYDDNEIAITGIARFDRLFAPGTPVKRQILIIPTWRDWITNDFQFEKSEYYRRYRTLLADPRLRSLQAQYQFEIIFCLHPNMQNFVSYFQQDGVTIIKQGDRDVQDLIKESALMITDYSSVGFDFSFLYKPVLYYQFDRDAFLGKYPSHLDLDRDLPGDCTSQHDELLDLLTTYCENDFQMLESNKRRADAFIAHRDSDSSKRIYEAIVKAKRRSFWNNVSHSEIIDHLVRRFNSSNLFAPVMKIYYPLARLLPITKDQILFESGLGKQYGDSPKDIYEALMQENPDHPVIWVYQQKLPQAYPGTKVIKKRSILYYYYLATSQYWINNQNFPTWVKKRKGQTYIQTWHGTPLKRMLHDLNQVYGRSEGYKDRVSQAINQWDYLISPSTYATRCFQSAFHYQKEILQVGYPRNDIFFQPDDVKEPLIQLARRRLSLPSDKKVILYAPTFRDHEVDDNNRFVFQLNLDLEALYQALHDEYVILIRLHVIISNKITIPKKYEHFIINASQYPDITDLYLLSDICITDYSSVMFDYANSRRPMLFYAYDLAYYRDTLRGFYLDYESQLPGPIVRTTQEWIDEVKKIDQYDAVYGDKYQTFIQTYCGDEHGTASQQIIDRFFTKHETH